MDQKQIDTDFDNSAEEMGTQSKLIVLGVLALTVLLAGIPSYSGNLKPHCGNGTCDQFEAKNSCPADCDLQQPGQ